MKITRNEILLNLLRAADGQWVSILKCVNAGVGFAVHSRAADLRRRGHNVENYVEHVGGEKLSFYRLALAERIASRP